MNDDDLAIFKTDHNVIKCNESDYKECTAMRRLIQAVTYRSLYKVMANENDAEIFTDFMNNVYGNFIDDYHHFQDHHSHQLEQIYNDFKQNKLFMDCSIKHCRYTERHHRAQTDERKKKDSVILDAQSCFYVSVMDSLHFQIFHVFEAGLRIRKGGDDDDDDDKEQFDEYKTNECFDETFARLQQHIFKRKHLTESFARFSTKSSKYNIAIETKSAENKENKENKTYCDELFAYLLSANGDIKAIKDITHFLNKEEYDTESMKYDEGLKGNGNITQNIENGASLNAYITIVDKTKVSDSSFAIGIRTYYWKYYEERTQLSDEEQCYGLYLNINNHSGYKVNELYVIAKYDEFKDEIMNYKSISLEQYEEVILVKVKKLLQSKKVKKTTATYHGATRRLHYDIDNGDPIRFEHLLALTLYTDYTALCTQFSSTFRAKSVFEPLQNIIQRNREYYWMSKCLRECVEIYGQCGRGDDRYGRDIELNGPFYCGMNVVMNIPAFAIRLCSPTSTTKQIEVAMKFSGSDGIVLQLNNDKKLNWISTLLHGFNTSWMSQFPEEDERLFVGGFWPIVIQSIRIIRTKQNFEEFIGVLCYLDAMLTAGYLMGLKVSKNDIFIINSLFENVLKKKEKKQRLKAIDEYIQSTFAAFALNKKHIVLDLYQLYEYANKEMRNLLMHNMDQRGAAKEKEREDTDVRNLFKPEIFDIFKNIESMTLQSTDGYDGEASYSLSMIGLLSLVEIGSVQEILVKAVTYYTGDNWIKTVWSSSSETLMKIYEEKNYIISMKQEEVMQDDGCVFVINKKH